MSHPLETYIRENRHEFDSFQPSPEIWSKIDTGLNKAHFFKSTFSWLKYFVFGASAVAIIVYLNLDSDNPSIIPANQFSTTSSEETKSVDTVNHLVPEINLAEFQATPIVQSLPLAEKQVPNNYNLTIQTVHPEENEVTTPPVTANVTTGSLSPKNGDHYEPPFAPDTLFEGVKRLEINCNNADIDVTSNSGNQIFFRKEFNFQEHGLVIGKNDHKMEYTRKDSTLVVTLINLSKTKVVIGSASYYALLSFDIPKETELVINDSYGNISVKDMKGTNLEMKNNSGNIKLENIISNMQLKLGYGNLDLRNTKGTVSAELTSGDIFILDHRGNIDVKTSYGNQKYHGLTGNIKTQSTSGDIKIMDMTGNADLTSKYGNIILEGFKGIPSIDVISGDVSGKMVELTGNTHINSKYGNIKMALVNPYNSMGFDLSVKYGTITIDKDGEKLLSEDKLMINQGTILIKSSVESGNQIFK
ncbi:MAG: hypothetical protein K0S44_1872 [Bacteroidetes bacterium]|jgi:DUF4097 and DUF4098 domain-containing protein YvlB|nr:hypothetical protein [Bacteroidota bacterium]